MPQKEKETREESARKWVNVKDIKGNILYTRDGYMMGYIRIHPFNIDLLSKEDLRSLAHQLAVSFSDDKQDFAYCSYPRELDLDGYKSFLKEKHSQEIVSLGRKRILEVMLQKAIEISSNGENFEHQHFIKLWVKFDPNVRNCEHDFLDRLKSFLNFYSNAGISAELLEEKEIIKLCNLFGNPQQATYEPINGKEIQERITFI